MSGFRLLQNKGSTFTELINKMEITNLKQMTKEEVFNLISPPLGSMRELMLKRNAQFRRKSSAIPYRTGCRLDKKTGHL